MGRFTKEPRPPWAAAIVVVMVSVAAGLAYERWDKLPERSEDAGRMLDVRADTLRALSHHRRLTGLRNDAAGLEVADGIYPMTLE